MNLRTEVSAEGTKDLCIYIARADRRARTPNIRTAYIATHALALRMSTNDRSSPE